MFSAFQASGFQLNAFQIIPTTVVVEEPAAVPTVHIYPYERYREEERKREELRREKTELERLKAVLEENERKKRLAMESQIAARTQKDRNRLAKLEAEYLEEINRLLAVRDMLMRRHKRNQAALLVIMAAKRRRLRI